MKKAYQFRVLPQVAMATATFDDETCVISILSPSTKPNLKINCERVLHMRFHDIDRLIRTPHDLYLTMSISQAHEIAEFFFQWWETKSNWVIQCEAGISRSPAVAIALSEYTDGQPNAHLLIEKYPFFNLHVYRKVWDALKDCERQRMKLEKT